MRLVAEKKAGITSAAEVGCNKEHNGTRQSRDLLSLLIKANMSTEIPESQRLSDEDVLARTSPV